MKLFGFNITRETPIESETFQAFSTPFRKVGDANLSLPKVDGQYTQAGGYVPFGTDNLYPQLLDQLYFTSPLHGAIIDFKTNAVLGGGYELNMDRLTMKEKVGAIALMKTLGDRHIVKAVLQDLQIHNRVYFIGKKEKGCGKFHKRVAPAKIRKNKTGDLYFYCEDWSRLINVTPLKRFRDAKDGEHFIWCYEVPSVGQDVYSLPTYSAANNWVYLDGEMSYLQKSNIQNAIFPSMAIKFPKKPQGQEEMAMLKQTIEKLKGAENGGKIAAFFANRAEDLPSFETITTNNNDGLFQATTESIENKICQAHIIDPILMGIRVSGKLGSGTDIKQAYTIFEKNIVMPLREEIEYIFNSMFKTAGIDMRLIVNDFQIINETIIETEDNKASATSDALNAMSPLVATKVLESMTQNEIRGLAGLTGVEGGDRTREEREAQVTNPTASPSASPTAEPEVVLNDALKGLTAKDNMDMMRIVRDFNKGKLPEALARTRLAAYGIDAETINEILAQ